MAVSLADGARSRPGRAPARTSTTGVLRVLHDRSFVDDPTRMLRLVRYAARLEFAADPHTEALIDPALLDTVTGDRAGNELRLLLREPRRALELLDALRVGPGAARRAFRSQLARRARRARAARARGVLHGDRP